MGKFPRRKRYRGRLVGWCRAEVLEWMARELTVAADDHERLNAARRCERRRPRQACLPLECSSRCTRAGEYSELTVREDCRQSDSPTVKTRVKDREDSDPQ